MAEFHAPKFATFRCDEQVRKEAQQLIADSQGPDALGQERLGLLLLVEDPAFYTHNGIDFSTPGAGATTITQSVSKRLTFTRFKPGLRKLRQSAYAIELEQQLSKREILAWALRELEFRKASRRWIKGFHKASIAFFGKPIAEINTDQYLLMIASAIAPRDLNVDRPTAKLLERVRRIKKLARGSCKPLNHSDVWLDGCR